MCGGNVEEMQKRCSGDIEGAHKEYRMSVEEVPRRCRVDHVNLVLRAKHFCPK